jgi:adenine phosphoribosyltransferase
MSIKLLKQAALDAPVVKMKDYYYVVHPITDGIPEITPVLLNEITHELKTHIKKCGEIDKIVTMEAMGIPLATALSLQLNLPFTVIRKRSYGLPDEISVEQVTGYSKSKLFINGLKKGDRVVLVDDVLSTGGTLRAVLSVLEKMGVNVKGVFIAIDKGDCCRKIRDEFDIEVIAIMRFDVVNGTVVIQS